MDLANYAVMTLVELRLAKSENDAEEDDTECSM